jgi:hypothetical protein
MFAYDLKGRVYLITDKGLQNIGITVSGDKHAVTVKTGKTVKTITEAGRVNTIEEVIAKFHVSSSNPLKMITEESRRLPK